MSNTTEEFPPELPEVDPIFIPYSPLKTGGQPEKRSQMEGSAGKLYCCICPFEAANNTELQHHTNACLDKQENKGRKEENEVMVSDDNSDEEANWKRKNGPDEDEKKRNGGIKSNVPDLEDEVVYQGFKVNFRRVVMTGLVESAKQNLFDIQSGKVRYHWNKGCFYAWLHQNVKDSENYKKSTLKRRVEQVEREAQAFVMSKKEGSKTGQGKMNKNINPDLHSERKDTYVEPKTQEEEEMKELGTTFAHLRREIKETPFKQKSKKVSPQQEAKARKLNSMLDDAENSNKDDEDDEDREKDEDDESEKLNYKQKMGKDVPTINKGTLIGKPSNMAEKGRRKREESIKAFYELRQEQRKDPVRNERKESRNPNEKLENVVIEAFTAVKESCIQRNQAPYPQQGIPPIMPYTFMGAPPPFSLPMQMPSPQMFQQPMGFQAPSSYLNMSQQRPDPVTAEVRISGTELDESSEHAPAGRCSAERPRESVVTSVTEEVDQSSYGIASARGRTSVIAGTGRSTDPGLPAARTSVISSAARSPGHAQPATGQSSIKKSTEIKHSKEATTGEKSKSSSPANAPHPTVDSSAMNGFGMSSHYGYQFMPGQISHSMTPQFGQISAPPSSTHMMNQFLPGQMSPPPTSPHMTQEAAQMSPELASTLRAQQAVQTSPTYPGMMSPPQIAQQMMYQQMFAQQQMIFQQQMLAQQFGHVSPPMIPRSPHEMMAPGSDTNSGAPKSKKGNKKAPSTKASDIFDDTD